MKFNFVLQMQVCMLDTLCLGKSIPGSRVIIIGASVFYFNLAAHTWVYDTDFIHFILYNEP